MTPCLWAASPPGGAGWTPAISGPSGLISRALGGNAKEMDLPEHRRAVYPEATTRLDFNVLGYPGDPALVGGRFYITFGRGTRPR